MAVLVTGVGYIGAALVARLLAQGVRVVGLENGYCTPLAALEQLRGAPDFTLIEGDVANAADVTRAFDHASALLDQSQPLTVYHLAAQPSAAVAHADPETTERTNLVGSRVVLQEAERRGARVIFGGSFRVYGDDLAGRRIGEDEPYGRIPDLSHLSKVYVEQLARTIGVPFVSLRLGVVYGIGPVMKAEPRFMTVPNVFCLRAVEGKVLEVVENRAIGFIHLEDAVQALLLAEGLLDPRAWWQATNAVTEVLAVGEVARMVQKAAEQKGRFVRILGVGSHTERFTVESRLPGLGFVPARTMDEALGEVFEHFALTSGVVA